MDNTSKMAHTNIVKFEDLVESNNNIYFFMEYCGGGTLEKHLTIKKKLTEHEALPLFKQLTEGTIFSEHLFFRGCVYLYDRSIIHRDLKPSNVLFSNDNVIRIADFGLSKAIADEIKDLETS